MTEALKAASRDRAGQTVDRNHNAVRKFEWTQFVAYLSTADMKFAKNGDMLLTLRVPYGFRDLAIPLSDAFGLPLSVDVQLWQPYREAQ